MSVLATWATLRLAVASSRFARRAASSCAGRGILGIIVLIVLLLLLLLQIIIIITIIISSISSGSSSRSSSRSRSSSSSSSSSRRRRRRGSSNSSRSAAFDLRPCSYLTELYHSYPCPCPNQLLEQRLITRGCNMKFVQLV